MKTRLELISFLQQYNSKFNEEQKFRTQFIDLLKSDRSYHRDHLPGHITGSAWIIDETKQYTLLTHHAKLNKWLQTGGHADGEENVLNVALREAEEESGLKNFRLLQPTIFDLDIHLIPERKDFPEHFHYDIRFLFEASMKEQIIISEESHDVAWKRIDEIDVLTNHNPSMIRMAEKTKLLS
jgi:8-oxo-dGTP pyrophosphatase MutT (NUDIX family)